MAEGNSCARILIADGQALFRAAMRKLLELDPDITHIREASNGREVIEQLDEFQPDIVLLDINMPKQSGLEVLRRIKGIPIKTRFILLMETIDRQQIVEALRLGAQGVMHKNTASRLLYKCLRAVMAEEYWVDRHSVGELVSNLRNANMPDSIPKQLNKYGLTRREFEIFLAVADGCTNKEIAEKLTISEQTVKHHLTKIFDKVGVSNRLELALFAMNQRMVWEA